MIANLWSACVCEQSTVVWCVCARTAGEIFANLKIQERIETSENKSNDRKNEEEEEEKKKSNFQCLYAFIDLLK